MSPFCSFDCLSYLFLKAKKIIFASKPSAVGFLFERKKNLIMAISTSFSLNFNGSQEPSEHEESLFPACYFLFVGWLVEYHISVSSF